MANNAQKYYLRVDDIIVSLDLLKPEFSKTKGPISMGNYLSIAVFTGLFKDQDDLILNLKKMGLLPSCREFDEVSIVKRKGNKKEGYTTEFVTFDIVYKRAAMFLSERCIKDFLDENKAEYLAIHELLEDYIVNLKQLKSIFEIKVHSIESQLESCSREVRQKLTAELESRTNSFKNFERKLTNILIMRSQVEKFQSCNYLFDRELELDYFCRLYLFVEDETRYSKKVPNARGIIRLALKIANLLDEYPSLTIPYKSTTNADLKSALLKAVRSALEKPFKLDWSGTIANPSSVEDAEDSIDPDEYMFLSEEDFNNPRIWNPYGNIPKEEVAQRYSEAIEDSIEQLASLKNRHGNDNGKKY